MEVYQVILKPILIQSLASLALLTAVFLPTLTSIAYSRQTDIIYMKEDGVFLDWNYLYRQRFFNDCGPAVIQTLLSRQSKYVFQEEIATYISDEAIKNNKGITLADFDKLATQYGLPGSWVHVNDLSRLNEVPTPFVAHLTKWDIGHFVIVDSVGYGYVLVADPSKGNTIYSTEEFFKLWSDRIYLFKQRLPK
jgi:ABC-type bacteriocin/lantibiotic exporter with double-glycine peptidase domain